MDLCHVPELLNTSHIVRGAYAGRRKRRVPFTVASKTDADGKSRQEIHIFIISGLANSRLAGHAGKTVVDVLFAIAVTEVKRCTKCAPSHRLASDRGPPG